MKSAAREVSFYLLTVPVVLVGLPLMGLMAFYRLIGAWDFIERGSQRWRP